MNVVDYVTCEICLFRYKLNLPKMTSTRRQVVEVALISDNLGSNDFHKNKTRQTKHNVVNTVVGNI